eukprot:6349716-Amphidinium_carterae.1
MVSLPVATGKSTKTPASAMHLTLAGAKDVTTASQCRQQARTMSPNVLRFTPALRRRAELRG